MVGERDALQEVKDPRMLIRHILTLPFSPPGPPDSRYAALPDGNLVALQTADFPHNGLRGKIGTIRRRALPDVESGGRLRPLRLQPNAGLFEPTHFILFLPHRILGMEYNFYGPRTSRLGLYLLEKCPNLVTDVEFLPLLRRDFQTKLAEMGEVSLIELGVRTRGLELVRELSESIYAGLRVLKRAVTGDIAPDVIAVTLKRQSPRRGSLFSLPFQRSRVSRFLGMADRREALTEFRVKANSTRTHTIEIFDLLEDKLISTTRVVLSGERRRAVDSESMFREIANAYEQNRDELLRLVAENGR